MTKYIDKNGKLIIEEFLAELNKDNPEIDFSETDSNNIDLFCIVVRDSTASLRKLYFKVKNNYVPHNLNMSKKYFEESILTSINNNKYKFRDCLLLAKLLMPINNYKRVLNISLLVMAEREKDEDSDFFETILDFPYINYSYKDNDSNIFQKAILYGNVALFLALIERLTPDEMENFINKKGQNIFHLALLLPNEEVKIENKITIFLHLKKSLI